MRLSNKAFRCISLYFIKNPYYTYWLQLAPHFSIYFVLFSFNSGFLGSVLKLLNKAFKHIHWHFIKGSHYPVIPCLLLSIMSTLFFKYLIVFWSDSKCPGGVFKSSNEAYIICIYTSSKDLDFTITDCSPLFTANTSQSFCKSCFISIYL